jgi:hypothetical protein
MANSNPLRIEDPQEYQSFIIPTENIEINPFSYHNNFMDTSNGELD